MAYNSIPTTEFDPGEPVKSEHGKAFFDNPTAIANHDDSGDTAPRVWTDEAAANASAISSTAAAGSTLKVSTASSPDGHGTLVVPVAPGGSDTYMLGAKAESNNAGTVTDDTKTITIDLDDRTIPCVSMESSILYTNFPGSTLPWPSNYFGEHGAFGAVTDNDSPALPEFYGVNINSISYDTATTTLTVSATQQVFDMGGSGDAVTTDFDVIADGTFKTLVSMDRQDANRGGQCQLQVSYNPTTDALIFRVVADSNEIGDDALCAFHLLVIDE